ncbi:MAG: hypothetical protein ACLP9L_12955 [Thermoguttaceae bacterium]
MNRMVVHSRIGADGILNITLPIGEADANREVQVTVDPVGSSPMTQEEWRNFVLSTAGSITDPSFVRHEQGEYEGREELP